MKKLYDNLFASGRYTKSFEEFKTQFSDANKSKTLFDKLSKSGSYDKTYDEFITEYEFPLAKTLDPADVDPAVESKNGTGSIWDQDSLVTSNTEDPDPVDGIRFIKFKDGVLLFTRMII